MKNISSLLDHFIDELEKDVTDADHPQTAIKFREHLEGELKRGKFIRLLIYSGFIPDYYGRDSSEEKLYSKLVESLVAEWARRMGYSYELITRKSNREDVKIEINRQVIVADSKSFRLGRSQHAPNPKDFVKLAQVRGWIERYDSAIGGLVTYPITHEWKRGSAVYEECSNKQTPTVMLPYLYLGYILCNKRNFDPDSLIRLWDYERIFPDVLKVDEYSRKNKEPYWTKMNREIINITNTTENKLNKFRKVAIRMKINFIREIVKRFKKQYEELEKSIRAKIDDKSKEELINGYLELQMREKGNQLQTVIKRIEKFRFELDDNQSNKSVSDRLI